ncbi:MAG TPA: chorismate synthase [Actinomycetes bacterium]|nr:chorismate synthase [Actinomycetes bacterium]
MLRYLTAGESHGPSLVAVLEGVPAGVPVTSKAIAADLARRRLGHGRGKRMRLEEDRVELLGGVRHGRTLGSPVAVQVHNSEWAKWAEVMAPDPPADPAAAATGRGAPLTRPRPGHADLTGMQKYGFDEARPVLERASARETAARVAVGAVARSLLRELDVHVLSHVVRLGAEAAEAGTVPTPADLDAIDASPVRCLDAAAAERMVAAVDAARAAGDTLGGVFEVVAQGLPPGLGSYVQWDRKLDARLAGGLMSIQAIKAVEVGDGFATAGLPGSLAHDEILPPTPGGPGRPRRDTNRSGGVEGGMSTGEPLRVRAAMKPLSTLVRALGTVDLTTGEPARGNVQRSDVTAVPAAAVVGEAVVALTLADALLEKTGGDSLDECRRNLDAYLATLHR